MRIRHLIIALLIPLTSLAWEDVARSQPTAGAPTQIRLGIYAPNSRFTGGSAFGYITGLARHVQRVTGIPTTGRVWRSAGAFSSAAGKLHYAVVDPLYLCFRRKYAVLATGRLGGSNRPSWGVFVRGGIPNMAALKGKRLALSGGAGNSFAEAMLGGRLRVSSFFSAVVHRKDLTSAVNAVKAGQADAVIAPVSMAKGLRRIFTSPSVPNAGLVVINRLPTLHGKVASALRGYGASGVGGWGGATSYACPAGRVHYGMVMVNQRYVPVAQAGMIRKLKPGKGYQLAPLMGHFRIQ